jgi:DNA-binding response OmpR family regulator
MVDKPKALLVEDSKEFVALGRRLLEQEGFVVTVTSDGLDAVGLARKLQPELLLLDISLPGLDGFEVCRRVREFSDAYVVMVTGRTEEVDRVVGLTVGADDYVTKPFSARELSARIAAMRRRPRVKPESATREFDGLSIDVDARTVELDGAALDLTRIEFDILAELTAEPRRVFSRAQLLTSVWGGQWFGDDHMVDVHVGNLRKKLGESGSNPRFVRTVRGVGFKFDPR